MKVAFSTTACPEWTPAQIIKHAAQLSYDGIEFRSFGTGSVSLPADPLLTGPTKLAELCEDAGVEPLVIATSVTFDQVVFPPVIGRILNDLERPVRQTKSFVEYAAKADIPFVRVFGFELQQNEPLNQGISRILEHLSLAIKTARHTGVRILLESGGSFSTAPPLRRLIDEASTADLTAAYSIPTAWNAGEDPIAGIRTLGNRLSVVKLGDLRNGDPRPLGDGDAPTASVVRSLAASGFDGTIVYELPRLWLNKDIDPIPFLSTAVERIHTWWAEAQPASAVAAASERQPALT